MRQTAKDLADGIDARLEGDGAVEIGGVAAPERAGASDLIYVDAAKHRLSRRWRESRREWASDRMQ